MPVSVDAHEAGWRSSAVADGSSRSSISVSSTPRRLGRSSPRASRRSSPREASQAVTWRESASDSRRSPPSTASRWRFAAASSSRCSGRRAARKTTSLRMIAGFERPDEGRILIGEADVTQTPPHRRPVNTVFQSYALFPHLSVEQNVAFGLRFTSVPKDEGRRRAAEVLELVRLGGYGERRPPTVGRSAAARCACTRTRALAGGAPPRRASGRARREAPAWSSGGAEGDPARRRHHVPVRDARPGGGADDVGPSRGAQGRSEQLGSTRGVRGACDGVRRGLPRGFEPHARHERGPGP